VLLFAKVSCHVERKAAAHAFGCCRTQHQRSSSPSSALIRLSQQHTAAASRLVANSATLTRGPQTSLPELNIQQPAGTADKVGVLLLNLGGPETLDDVEHFLFNLFNDPDIIRLPGQGMQQQWCLPLLLLSLLTCTSVIQLIVAALQLHCSLKAHAATDVLSSWLKQFW